MAVRSQGYGQRGPKGDKGDASTVPGPKGADSTVPGPKGADSTVPGPKGDKGDTGPSARVVLPNITLAGQILVGVLAGPRKHTVACAGAQVGDTLVLTPIATMPVGYMQGDACCLVAGQVEATLFTPSVTLLANYSVTFKVTAVR